MYGLSMQNCSGGTQMKTLKGASLAVSTLLLVACGGSKSSNNAGVGENVGIVGGAPVSVADPAAAHVVGLIFIMKAQPDQPPEQRSMALCTGTLVTKDIVLTAAHCAAGDFDR